MPFYFALAKMPPNKLAKMPPNALKLRTDEAMQEKRAGRVNGVELCVEEKGGNLKRRGWCERGREREEGQETQ